VGISVSNNWVDNAWLLQARESTCRNPIQQVTHWTKWLTSSSEDTLDGTECYVDQNEIIGQMQCRGAHCREKRLGCFQISSSCELERNVEDLILIHEGEEELCPDDMVLTGLVCVDERCHNHIIRSTKLKKAQ